MTSPRTIPPRRKNPAIEEDESAKKGDWYANGDIEVDIGPAEVKLQLVQTIKGDDSDPAKGTETGFGAKITGDLGDLSLSAGADVVLTGATDDEPAKTDYELGAGLGFALSTGTKLEANYIYATDKDVASDMFVELKDDGTMGDGMGLIENVKLGLAWGAVRYCQR